jgi:hypothetical protein
MGGVVGSIEDPAVAGGYRVLGIIVVMCNLTGRRAVTLRHPDLIIPAAVRAPQQILVVPGNKRVPIHGGMIGEAAERVIAGGNVPKIQLPAS